MKQIGNKRITNSILILGIALILVSLVILGMTYFREYNAEKEANSIVSALNELMPPPRDAMPQLEPNATMPSLQVAGEDFVGILTVPSLSKALPVGASWQQERIADYPCRFYGSVNNGTLMIGGTDNNGQLDFVEALEQGTQLQFTDVSGNRYTYRVSFAEQRDDLDQNLLSVRPCDLIVFSQNTIQNTYTAIYASMIKEPK